MTKNRTMNFAIVLAAVVLVGGGCAKQKTDPASGKAGPDGDLSTVSGNEPYNEQSTAGLTVANQAIVEGTITIPKITMGADGWIVIHADNGGVPGEMVGSLAVAAGESKDVKVSVDAAKTTDIVHAMLHVDAGVKGTLEFPGPDVPVTANDVAVSGSFKIEKSAAATVKTETKTDVVAPSVEKIDVKAEVKTEAKAEVKPAVRNFSITAKSWEFSPSTITVKKGDKVRLSISSTDVNHGFNLADFNISQQLKPGQTSVVEFTADKSGSFSFSCNVFCGSGHQGMRGTLVVTE